MNCCNLEKKTIRSDLEKKQLNIRLNKIIGQLNGVKKMIDDDRYCEDILIQLSAIDKSIKSLSMQILNRHLHTCITTSIKNGDDQVIDEILALFKRFN